MTPATASVLYHVIIKWLKVQDEVVVVSEYYHIKACVLHESQVQLLC